MVKKITEIMKEQPEQKAIVQKYELRKLTLEEWKQLEKEQPKQKIIIKTYLLRDKTLEQLKKEQAQSQSDHKGV